MSKEQPEALQLPALPFAVFDEFGQPCEDRVRDHFAAAFEALRAQIGQGEPDDAAAKERDRILSALKRHDWHSSNIWRYYYPSSTGDWVDLRELRKLLAQFPTAPQHKPLTDEQQIAEALRKHGFALVKTATGYDVMKLGPCIAHNIGAKE